MVPASSCAILLAASVNLVHVCSFLTCNLLIGVGDGSHGMEEGVPGRAREAVVVVSRAQSK